MVRKFERRGGKSWRLDKVLAKGDSFSKKVPGFNIRGENRVATYIGGLATLWIFSTVLFYGLIKIIHLLTRHNPLINENIIANQFPKAYKVELNEIKFRAAFSFESYFSRETINDSRYVKWIAKYITSVGGEHI